MEEIVEKLNAAHRKDAASKRVIDQGEIFKEERNRLASELAVVKLETSSAKESLETLKTKFDKAVKEKLELDSEVDDAHGKLSVVKAELESERNTNKLKLKELSAKHQSVLSQLANEKVASSKNEKEAVKALKQNYSKMVTEKDQAISAAQAEILSLKESLSNVRAEKAANKIRDSSKWSAEKKSFEDRIAELEEQLVAAKLEADKMKAIRSENERFHDMVGEEQNKNAELRASIERSKQMSEELKASLRESREEKENLARELKDMAAEIAEVKEEEQRLKTVVSDNDGKFEHLQEAKDKVDDELKFSIARVEELSASLSARASEIQNAQSLFGEEEERFTQTMRQLDEAKTVIHDMEKKNHTSAEELDRANARIKELVEELDRANVRIKELMEELDSAIPRIKELEEALTCKEQLPDPVTEETNGKNKDAQDNEVAVEPVGTRITHADVKMILKHIGNIDDDACGRVSVMAFEKALRIYKKAKCCAKEFAHGRELTFKLERILDAQNMTVATWFKHLVDAGKAITIKSRLKGGSDEKAVTSISVLEGLRFVHKLAKSDVEVEVLSEQEMKDIVRYFDPNLDEHITKSELKHAVRRAHLPPNSLYAEYQCGIVMKKIEDYMQNNHQRISDVFNLLDKDHNGTLSLKEFEKGIHDLVGLTRDNEDDRSLSIALLRGEKEEIKMNS